MKLRDLFDFLFFTPASFKASAEEEHDSKLRGL